MEDMQAGQAPNYSSWLKICNRHGVCVVLSASLWLTCYADDTLLALLPPAVLLGEGGSLNPLRRQPGTPHARHGRVSA